VNTEGGAETPLEELAREGRTRAQAAAAEEARRQREEERASRREVLRIGRTYLLDALVEQPRVPQWITLLRVMAATALCCVLWIGGDALGLPRLSGVGLAGVLVLPFAWFAVRRLNAVRLLRVERAWLHDLPFPVFGYFDTLSASPDEECTLRVKVWTHGEGPSDEVMEGIAGLAGGATSVTRSRGGWRIQSGVLRSPAFEDSGPTNGARLGWMRSVIEQSLLPLHRVHPIRRVEFGE
jgi:hypothetical protein